MKEIATLLFVALVSLSCSQAASLTPIDTMMPQQDLPTLEKPRIVIKKADRKLEVFDGDKLIKTYQIALGFTPKGDKEVEGDGKTPEGTFYIFIKNPNSKFHLSLGISYPSKDDAERGLSKGLISKDERDDIAKAIDAKKTPLQKTALGGEIYIHGGGTLTDWTDGCIALTNQEIGELFNAIPAGTDVEILP